MEYTIFYCSKYNPHVSYVQNFLGVIHYPVASEKQVSGLLPQQVYYIHPIFTQ